MWQPMSGHRDVLPYLAFFIDMHYFDGLNHFLVCVGVLLDLCILMLLISGLCLDHRLDSVNRIILGVFVITEFTWLLNIALLGWGFMSTQYYLAILACLLSAHFLWRYLATDATYWLWLCLLAGIVSTFSFGVGLLVWPILIYLALLTRRFSRVWLPIFIGLPLCFGLFLLLPGSNQVTSVFHLQPIPALTFLFQLPGGPVYFLLRSLHLPGADILKTFSFYIGTGAATLAIVMLCWRLYKALVPGLAETFALVLMLIGLGAPLMISTIRPAGFLDPCADRYQIWATLLWVGLLIQFMVSFETSGSRKPMLALRFLMISLPVLALPSQLDFNARLADYNNRVHQALLLFRVGVPDETAAKDALHWNWQHELHFLFIDWPYLKTLNKNIFHGQQDQLLGQNIEQLLAEKQIHPIPMHIQCSKRISTASLLLTKDYPAAAQFPFYHSGTTIAGYRLGISVATDTIDGFSWDTALAVDANNTVIGIGIPVDSNTLPRSNLNPGRKHYNLFGVIRHPPEDRRQMPGRITWYIFNSARPGVIYQGNQLTVADQNDDDVDGL